MINFFRKTRKKLADDNKPLKYARYAIGEIVLVMIGILLALQVNNWNEERKDRQEEQIILKNLKLDFKDNLLQIHEKIRATELSQQAISTIVQSYVNKEVYNPTHQILDSLMVLLYYRTTFDPKSESINELFNSGKLKVLQNRELKNSLFSWTSNLQEVKEVEARTLDIRGQFHNYLADKIPLADLFILDRIGPKFNFKSNFKVNHKVILSDLRFENILSSRSFWQTMLLNRYHLTEENIEKILRMIEEDIKH